jgi:putative ABC transport system substrate-binding protein
VQRREFITVLGGAAASWPLATQAQQGARGQQVAIPVIGFLTSVRFPASADFIRGLSEQGYVEGRNVRIEYRSADNHYDRLPELASQLVSLPVNVIFAGPGVAALAAKGATSKIPIVFLIGIDAVESGLVASYNSPGGNVTGVCVWQASMTPKLFEMLHQLLPKAAPFAFLINTNNMFAKRYAVNIAQPAAENLGRNLVVVGAGTEGEIDQVFENLAQRGGGLVVEQEAFFQSRSGQIAALGLRYKLPVLFASRPFAEAGGLISYSANGPELNHQVGIYVGKILNGASPASLPVFQPTKYELVINLKTAKALSIDIPPTLLAQADEVIE